MTAALIKIQTVDPVEVNTIGEWSLNSTISVPTPTFVERVLAIGTVNVPVAVPSGSTTVTITPPSDNTGTITLRGDPTDIGISLSKTQPTQLSLSPTQTILNFTCASSIFITFTFI